MKFMMNGALTVGTLDGANVEMHDLLGDDNMFLFGLHADEVEHLRHTYDPNLLYQRDPVLRRVLDQLKVGFRDGVTYEDLFQRLVTGMDGQADQYMVLADFAAYCEAESRMRHTYRDRETWNRMSLTNIARSGVFAADRASPSTPTPSGTCPTSSNAQGSAPRALPFFAAPPKPRGKPAHMPPR